MSNTLPPSLKPGWIGGHFFKFRRRPTEFLTELASLGDITYMRMHRHPSYFLNHPDLIRDLLVTSHSKFHKGLALQRAKPLLGEGLLTNEGESHLRQRRMIQPAFHRKRIAEYAKSMSFYADRMASSWTGGEEVEIDKEMTRLTLEIVGKTLFNAEVDKDAKDVGEAMTELMNLFNFLLVPFSDVLQKLPIPPAKRCRDAQKNLDRVIYSIINERRKSGNDEGDLLSMLLLAQDEDDGGSMDDKQVRDEALTLFIAGHETTANALIFTWYLLSEHPDKETKLNEELEQVLGGRVPGFEDVPKLKYTEAVIAESMRLYPPAWAMGRLAIEKHRFGEYDIPENALVLISPFTIQRDERFWNKPDEFIPERWAEKSIKQAGQEFIFIPFSRGVRSCIGESFAWMELVLVVATIAQKWKLRMVPEQKFGLSPVMTLRPKYGMRMQTRRR
ncbi:MAG: cytochrome P450 [Pyrinomonadaceae bacterium]|nr:cytochrome P450 [Pyrinomonadaceae bacterium]